MGSWSSCYSPGSRLGPRAHPGRAAGSQPGARSASRGASGDLLIHTPLAARALALGGGRTYDFAPMFDPVRAHIARADLALCHVETPLVPGPVQGLPELPQPALARPLDCTGGLGCLSTASNHSLDAGAHGIATTLRALDRAGIRHAGTARSLRERARAPNMSVKGVRVGFLSYTAVSNGQLVPKPWMLDWADPERVIADARRIRSRGAELVIVNLHWGAEYVHGVTPTAGRARPPAYALARSRRNRRAARPCGAADPARERQGGGLRRGQPDLQPDGRLLRARRSGRADRPDRLRRPPGPPGASGARPLRADLGAPP